MPAGVMAAAEPELQGLPEFLQRALCLLGLVEVRQAAGGGRDDRGGAGVTGTPRIPPARAVS